MSESSDDTILKTIDGWRLRRRADGTHYAEDGKVLATTTEADKLFELREQHDPDPYDHPSPFREAAHLTIPTSVLGELLAEELGRGRHPGGGPHG